jgi:hypothetical protein
MRKNKFYSDFSADEIIKAKELMNREMRYLDYKHPIRFLYMKAWADFTDDKFSYDGPTFVRSRFKSRWELASFIHDWRNSNGNVGREVDNEFFSVMIALNYPIQLIIERWMFCRLTFINVWRHIIKGTYNKKIHIKLYLL